jgi:hypothetical protein
MQPYMLVVPHILDHAARWHGEQTVVCRTTEGPVATCTYAELHRRARLCALALRALGVGCARGREEEAAAPPAHLPTRPPAHPLHPPRPAARATTWRRWLGTRRATWRRGTASWARAPSAIRSTRG